MSAEASRGWSRLTPRYAWAVPTNHLADATSPYLRQHAHQPVEWYPWGDAALSRAAAEDKPLFISIGYASCHWCHVMAHETFDDEEVAALLNESFISIKIDREERPDLDAVYMSATQAQNGHGGWPMSVFATPDGRPFYTGTYFPPEDRHGLPGFTRLVTSLAGAWVGDRAAVEERADTFFSAVATEARFADDLAVKSDGATMPSVAALLTTMTTELAERYDPKWGGFSPAPKFPRPSLVECALLAGSLPEVNDPRAMEMALRTLDAMAAGGIYDHIAGGFARYSTDAEWLVPHFEKMLTDQALLARAYLHAYQVTGNESYAQIVRETLTYVLDELWADEGALYSSHDADAGGHEGSHATFTKTSVQAALTAAGLEEHTEEVCAYYGIEGPATFEGSWIPVRPIGAATQRPPHIEAARVALLDARRRRVQPEVDTKILLEWNAMAAAALAEAGRVLGEERFAAASVQILQTCLGLHTRADGRLLRSASLGRSEGLAQAGDYVWLAEACLQAYELTANPTWLGQAVETANALLRGFWDGAVDADSIDCTAGGLYGTGHDAPVVLAASKDVFDAAIPAANSVAASTLRRLAALSGDARFEAAAQRIIDRSAALLAAQPSAASDLVLAVIGGALGGEVVIPGPAGALLEVARRPWLPGTVIAHGALEGSPLFEGREVGTAYVCHGQVCDLPVTTPPELEGQLMGLLRTTPR